jgi:hypothetical protein
MTSNYFSYLLRFWQSDNQTELDWYASLEDTKSHHVIYFKNLDQMVNFLRDIQSQKNNCSDDYSDQKIIQSLMEKVNEEK